MTELERQLVTALKRLSAQFRTEQRQHADEQQRQAEQNAALWELVEQQAAQAAALQRRVERLSAQVTRLARNHGAHAATERRHWT